MLDRYIHFIPLDIKYRKIMYAFSFFDLMYNTDRKRYIFSHINLKPSFNVKSSKNREILNIV